MEVRRESLRGERVKSVSDRVRKAEGVLKSGGKWAGLAGEVFLDFF